MKDEALITAVHKHRALYDLSHPKYLDGYYKNAIWKRIGQELRTDGSACKSRWNNMRDQYRKNLKKVATKKGQESKIKKQYKYSVELAFLNPFFQDRKPRKNFNSEDDEYALELSSAEDDEVACEEKIQNQETEDNSTRTSSPQYMEYVINKNETSQLQNPIDAFLAGIAPTLKNLSPYYQNLAKSEIFAVVQKYEMQMLTEMRADCSLPNIIDTTTAATGALVQDITDESTQIIKAE